MKISALFGIKFARKFRYKAQLISEFKRWKREKQYFLAEERNRYKLLERFFFRYIKDHPRDPRPYEDIIEECLENITIEVAKTNWQKVYERILGKDVELPNYQVSPHISRKETKDLFRDYNCKHYYFTDSAIQECEKVQITELDMDWLIDVPDGKRQLNWGDQFIRFEKKDNRIIAIAASFTRRQECKYLQYTFFVFDLNAPKLPYDPVADLIKEQCEKDLDDYPGKVFENKMRMLLYKMITFLDLIPLKKIRLPAWGCLEADDEYSNQVNCVEPVYNNDNVEIIVVTVDVNWNCSIYIEETWVTGHFKNVLFGPGRSKVKRRFVKGLLRQGYERKAGKLKAANSNILEDPNKVMKTQQKEMAAVSLISENWKAQQKETVGKGQSMKPEHLNEFQTKLAELKKKFNAS